MTVWEDKVPVHYVTTSSMVLGHVSKGVSTSIALAFIGHVGGRLSTLGLIIVGIMGASPS
jgi:hypothetical protein